MATSSFTRRFYVSKNYSDQFVDAVTAPVVAQKKAPNVFPMAKEKDYKVLAKTLINNSIDQ
jgi:hypothetical protein